MIKLIAYYKNLEGKKFNLDYYLNSHLPMIKRLTGDALKQVAVDKGFSGGEPGSKPFYLIVAHLYFDNIDAFQSSLVPHFAEIMSDVPNYTDIEPVFQISEVLR
ncbi:EthD family reductase [Chitinophaga sp. CF118]|uniref:EthD family reductase n=1 Tax=Chitinophaga sp. CF118 TaxID=1884367 RepID=UPI000B7D9615|nr:EthD family reductase [Chitinophaga sp. CF118]